MIQIDPEFQALIPPLAPEERQQLEANILADGCRDPLVVWNVPAPTPANHKCYGSDQTKCNLEPGFGVWHCTHCDHNPATIETLLIDGHNRYEICTKHGIDLETVEKEFADRSQATEWIIRNQFGRRNLTAYVRTQLALRLEETIAKRAEDSYKANVGRPSKSSQKSAPITKVDTRQEVAKIASVSHDTVAKVKVIEQKAAPEVKQKLSTGEVSINQAYQEIRKEEKKAKQSEVLHSRSADKARKTAKLKNSLFEVRRGDFREVLGDVESVSLILTDPPYPKDALPLWRDLGKWAADALADDGILVAYSGQLYLPQVLNNLSESLEYWWCGAVVHKGTGNLTPLSHPVRKVINCWKPLVMFYKKGGVGFERTFKDLVEGVGPQKTDHNWQQPVEEAKMIINAFTNPGDLVVDPFAGSGGFCKAAHDLGRIAVGAEILNDE